MRRNYIPFIAGMSTMLLLVGLVGASMAEETSQPAVPQSGTLNGQVAYGEAGVALFGKEQVPAGTAWTTEDGTQVPTVLTYTDENGEDHYFVSAETTAEVLDMVYGVVYREDLNCIDFGTEVSVDPEGNPRLDENGQPTYWTGAEFFPEGPHRTRTVRSASSPSATNRRRSRWGTALPSSSGTGWRRTPPSGMRSSSGRWRRLQNRSMALAVEFLRRWIQRSWTRPPIWAGSWTAWPFRGRI